MELPLFSPPTALSETPSWPRNLRTSCDACKRLKIGCLRKDNKSCVRCIARKLDCVVTQVERKKPRLTTETQLLEMADRIKRMESVIVASGLQETAETAAPAEPAEPTKVKEEEKSSSDQIESQAGLSNQLSNLIIDPEGSPNFIGWASGFSILSPQGLRWISEKVGNKDELAQLVRKVSKQDPSVWGRAEGVWDPMPRSQHSPLPSKDVALQYINNFFIKYNNVLPVVSQKVFESYVEKQYSTNPLTGTAWYALLNAVLCLGSISTKGEQEGHTRSSYLIDYTSIAKEDGFKYFRNASSCFLDLLLKEANLMAMQAMTLMLLITSSSPNPQPAYILTSAAGNIANTMGLHQRLDSFGLSPEEIEQRRNVFWVFYLTEKAISHNLGRPSIINDDDIAVDLPPKMAGLIQSPSGAKVYDIFRDQIMLAIIGSRIYSELYSASSQTKSEIERMKVLGKLDNHLQGWRDSIPIDIRPEHPIKCSDEQYVPVVMMHFTYLDAVILLHRLSVNQESFKDGGATNIKSHDQRLRMSSLVYASQMLCLAAARRSVQLLDTLNNNYRQSQNLTWMALYYPLSASLVLFANILSNPQDQHAAADIQLMNTITSFISRFVQPGTSFAATPTVTLFKELYSIAERFVARVPRQPSQKMKRPHESDEHMQPDFISPSGIGLAPDWSLHSDLKTETTTSLSPQPTTHPTFEIPEFGPYAASSGPEPPQGYQDTTSTTSNKSPQESTDASPLSFAPFIPSEPNLFDYNPTIYDSLLSPVRFEWDMANMWMPSFAPDPLISTDLMGSSLDVGIDYGGEYFDGNEDDNNPYLL